MDIQVQIAKAQAFRKMHDRSEILLLPNAWDGASARLLERAGFAALATTSGGVAWSLGYPDGEHAPLAEVLAVSGRIAHAVDAPLSFDLESGYGATPDDVAATVAAAIAAGAAGVNLEDGLHAPGALRDVDQAAARIAAAREAADSAGVPIVINARTDGYLVGFGAGEEERFAETVRRAETYVAAGADCIFTIGLADGPTIRRLARAIRAPLNVAVRPGMPDLAELAQSGVARVSTATRMALVAYSALDRAAKALRGQGGVGGFGCLDATLTHPDMQRLFD